MKNKAYEISYIYTSVWTLACLGGTKWTVKTLSSNCFSKESIFIGWFKLNVIQLNVLCKTIFCHYPELSKQNNQTTEKIHKHIQKKEKKTSKHKVCLKTALIEIRVFPSTYGLNISLLFTKKSAICKLHSCMIYQLCNL